MVKFVKYTGEYPCLCMGDLMLEIDGKLATFGYNQEYPKFWISGGGVWFDSDWNEYVSYGEWIFDFKELPAQFRKYQEEIAAIFNANIKRGCCGGCI